MLVPLSWLKEYVDINVTAEELEKKLFDSGFEVEELIEVGKDVTKVVVGYVETCEAIPDTHLHLCQVDTGVHGKWQICCGADNVVAGKNSLLHSSVLPFMQRLKTTRQSRAS